MNTGNFNTYYENIDHKFWRNLCVEEGELKCFGKGEAFMRQGEVARYIGYIKSGRLKYVTYGSDGCEHVVGLEFEGEFVADFPFSLYGEKARISIIAVTPCEIYCTSTRRLRERLNHDHHLRKLVSESTTAIFDTVYNRYLSLHSKTPQERYDELLEKYNNIFSLFPLKDIASYLNITPTHLSRLRSQYKAF